LLLLLHFFLGAGVNLHTKFGFLNFKVPNDIWFVCAAHQIWFEMFFFITRLHVL